MRTFKENVIELADGESVIIRAERGSGQKEVSIQVHCVGWYDYVGQPNGLDIRSQNEVRNSGEALEDGIEGLVVVEVVPSDLKLNEIEQPTLTTNQQ